MHIKPTYFSLLLVFLFALMNTANAQGSFGGVPIAGLKIVIDNSPPMETKVKNLPSSQIFSEQKKMGINNKPDTELKNNVTASTLKESANMTTLDGSAKSNQATSKSTKPKSLKTLFTYTYPDLFSGLLIRHYNNPQVRKLLTANLQNAISEQIQAEIKKSPDISSNYKVNKYTNLQLGNLAVAAEHYISPVNRININITLPRNRYFLGLSSPDIFKPDLNAFVFFDINIHCSIDLPQTTSMGNSLPRLGDITVTVSNITKPESRNLISKAAIEITQMVLGPSKMREMLKDRNMEFPMDQYNQQLTKIKGHFNKYPGLPIEARYENDLLVLKAANK